MNDTDQLALALRARRIGLGLPREEIATRLGVTPYTVGAWERGDRRPSGPARAGLAGIFECSVDDLEIAPEGASHDARLASSVGRPKNDPGVPFSGLALRTWRARRDVTQAKLSDRSAVSTSTICELERDQRLPTRAVLQALAHALGCEVEDLAQPPVLARPEKSGEKATGGVDPAR